MPNARTRTRFVGVGPLAVLLLLSSAATSTRAAPPAAKGLVAYWPLDGKDARRVRDHVGGRHGVIGADVRGRDAGLPAGTGGPASISLWFKPAGRAEAQVLFGYGTLQRGRARGLWLPRADTLSFFHWGGPDLAVRVGAISPARWHHVAGIYDGRGVMSLYFNGRRVGRQPGQPDTRTGGSFFIGRSPDGTKPYYGMIDDVAVYASSLGDADVASLYNKGVGRAAGPAWAGPAEKKTAPPRGAVVSRAPGHLGKYALRFAAPSQVEPAAAPRANPADVGCKEIIFAVRQTDPDGHWYANFGYDVVRGYDRPYYHDGGRLCRLNLADGKVTTLLADATGGVRDPQVHYDGKKILFSYRKGGQPFYRLYEINVDGTGLKQITDGPYDDFEPAYLPDGGIIFCSSRCKRWVPCYTTQVAVLFRCDGDGKNIRQLSANVEQENTPWVLPDGRVLYQRWEYVDRSQVGYHHLWTMNPDGTGQMVYYGNMHPNTVMIDAKPIPGTKKVVASFSPGHGRNEHAGAVTIVDPRKGPDARDMARSVGGRRHYRDPYPLTEDRFLVADGTRVLLLARGGQTATLFDLPAAWRKGRMQVHEPRPLRARPREQVLPSRVDMSKATGQVVLENVTIGRNMKGVKPGEIKKLLVLEILSKPYNMFSGMEPLTYGGSFLLERILGTVPVEPDGSAYFKLPAMRPLFFVALDKDGMAVKRMQSFMTVQPGESVSCIGCHEERGQPPKVSRSVAARRRVPSEITPLSDVPDVFDFPRDIQPILDKHCVACHDYDKTPQGGPRAGGVILTGDRGPMFSHSYYTLTARKEFSDGRNLRKSNYPPRTIGSPASPLLKRLDGSHYKARLSAHEKKMLRLWIDTGAAYPGTYAALGSGMLGHYSENRRLTRQDLTWPSTAAARAVVRRRCASCHKGSKSLPDSPSDNKRLIPWTERRELIERREFDILRFNRHGLYNLSRPAKSLMLLAPLSRDAGGYAVGPKAKGPGKTPPACPVVFKTTADPDYTVLLGAITDAKAFLDKITRFDKPGFKPRPEYIREMKRYGLLDKTFDAAKQPIDVYKMDRQYWQSLHYRPVKREGSQQGDTADEYEKRIRKLERGGDVAGLVAEIGNTQLEAAKRALWALGHIGTPEATGHVGKALAGVKRKEIRSAAATVIGSTHACNEVDGLLTAMVRDKELSVRRSAAGAVWRILRRRNAYDANAPESKRKADVDTIRADWTKDKEHIIRFYKMKRKQRD